MFEIGNTLREARLRRGIDLPRCETETKIRSKYLRAMEEEQFDVLPAPTYVRGFLRSYAEYLGLDWQLVLDEYESRFGAFSDPSWDGERPAPRRRPARREERRSPETRLLWLAGGGVMTVALLVWLGVGGPSDDPGPLPPTPPAAAADPPAGQERFAVAVEGTGDGTDVTIRAVGPQGRVIFASRLQPGQRKAYRIAQSLWLEIDDPDGVTVTVGGVRREPPGPGGYLVTREGLSTRTAG